MSLGLYQGIEFVIRSSPFEILRMGGLVISRLRTSLVILRRGEIHRFKMRPDIDQTANILADFLKEFATRNASIEIAARKP